MHTPRQGPVPFHASFRQVHAFNLLETGIQAVWLSPYRADLPAHRPVRLGNGRRFPGMLLSPFTFRITGQPPDPKTPPPVHARYAGYKQCASWRTHTAAACARRRLRGSRSVIAGVRAGAGPGAQRWGGIAAPATVPAVRAGALCRSSRAGRPPRVRESTEDVISAGEGLAIASASARMEACIWGGAITISRCATSNRFLRTTVSSGPLPMMRSCSRAARGAAWTGTVSLPAARPGSCARTSSSSYSGAGPEPWGDPCTTAAQAPLHPRTRSRTACDRRIFLRPMTSTFRSTVAAGSACPEGRAAGGLFQWLKLSPLTAA